MTADTPHLEPQTVVVLHNGDHLPYDYDFTPTDVDDVFAYGAMIVSDDDLWVRIEPENVLFVVLNGGGGGGGGGENRGGRGAGAVTPGRDPGGGRGAGGGGPNGPPGRGRGGVGEEGRL